MTESPFANAWAAIDHVHKEDPETLVVDGQHVAREWLYAERMTAWLRRVAPAAGDALQLAVRAQHLRRWALARSDYPPGRVGYKKWRSEQARRHAEETADILRDAGYDVGFIERVCSLIRKQKLTTESDAQALEDTACLVFLEHEYVAFAAKHEDEKVVSIVQKTWAKMSTTGQSLAAGIAVSGRAGVLLSRALNVRNPSST